jgi:uncharacterized protein (DUF488 family)
MEIQMPSRAALFTTGYAGHDQESFLKALRRHDVEVIVDVRQNPVSRKRGFSKTKLAEFLTANGLEYVHAREMGVPSDLRAMLRDGTCELKEYLAIFNRHLLKLDTALNELYELAIKRRCCLLCVEHESEECHRSVVAKAVAARNGHKVRIEHI